MTDSTTPAQPPNSLPFSNLRTSEKIDKILPAFLAAWTEIEAATKDSLNPHFKSHYADLAACMEAIKAPLVKAGLLMMQPPKVEGKTISVETVVFHAASSQWLSSVFTLTSEDGKPQAIGSAISYARRYGLGAMFSLYSELDDDGKQEIYLAIHVIGGSCSTRMTREQAVRLVEGLQEALAHNAKVV